MTSLLNMVDYEQIKFYVKMVAESQKGTVTISFKDFLVSKKLLKDTCGYKIPVWDRLNKTFTPKHNQQITLKRFNSADHQIRETLTFTADLIS